MYSYRSYQQEYHGFDIKAKVYEQLGLAFFISAITVGIMIYLSVPLPLYYIGAFGEFIIIGVLFFSGLFGHQFSESTARFMLYAFTVCSSITLSLLVYIGLAINPLIIAGSVGLTSVVVLVAYLMSDKTGQIIGQLTKVVLVLVIVFVLLSLFGLFFWSDNPVFYILTSLFGAIIFGIYLFIDMARLEKRAFTSPSMMALWIFYDIIFLLKELISLFIYIAISDRR